MRADRAIEQSPILRARVAGQAGLVTRAQAVSAGIGPEAIRWAVSSRRWVAPHPGVYLTTPGRDDWEVRAVAALLYIGGDVALAGTSAALAWGLERREPADVEVIVPAGRRASMRPGIAVTRSRVLGRCVHPRAWPHRTTVEHTVLDLGLRRPLDRVLSLAGRACQLRLTDEARLVAALSQRPHQTHRAVLLECLADLGSGAESAAEVRYVRDVERAHGLPVARRQEPLGSSRRCDNLYEPQHLLLEIDGRLGHEGWSGRVRDGRRDRASAQRGRLTVRGYWPDVAITPCAFAVEVATLLRLRGWSGAPKPCRRRDCALRVRPAA